MSQAGGGGIGGPGGGVGGGGGSRYDEHPDEPQPQTFSCPKCGHSLTVGTPICGNCGTILQGGSYVPEPLAAHGFRPGPIISIALTAALGIAGFLGRDSIGDFFSRTVDDVSVDAPNFPDIDIPDIDPGDPLGPRVPGARNVGQIVREIRAAGIPCTQMDVQSADDYVATGSCQSEGRHVQINIYFRQVTFDAGRDFFISDWPFATAQRDNWWISGDTAVVRAIARGLDAKFRPPS